MNPLDSTAANRCDTDAWMTLRWTRGTRYYRVHLEQDLWNHWLLTLVHGRRGTPLGRSRVVPAPSFDAALRIVAAVAQRRRRRGYASDIPIAPLLSSTI
jgi:hypothetical protein